MAPTMPEYHPKFESDGRKRVPKACDRCRLKKVKVSPQKTLHPEIFEMLTLSNISVMVICHVLAVKWKTPYAILELVGRALSDQSQLGLSPVLGLLIKTPVTDRLSSYVDQLELQQKLLIKALKETWKRFGPIHNSSSLANDPSVHDIVEKLGVLEEAPGNHAVLPDFRFDERLIGPSLSVRTEITPPPSEHASSASNLSPASLTPPEGSFSARHSTAGINAKAPSPTLSPMSGNVSPTSAPLQTLQHGKSAKKMPSTTAVWRQPGNNRTQKPGFCPLPPRPNFSPTVPTKVDWNGVDGLSGMMTGSGSSAWVPSANEAWSTQNTNFIMDMAPKFDQGLEGLGQGMGQVGDDMWSSWMNDQQHEYGILPLGAAPWSQSQTESNMHGR